ncbi:hypothetical protein H0H87_006950 [Tephrocybe sp. NHM501043]|nr:hypothetical protein H0H87_006950 [Tephrocybe sp. NHM501043]
MEPIRTLIYGLRRYDLDRCQALLDMSDPANANVKVVGFMSHKSKIYLADVFDHMEYILTSLDMFASIAENLIGYMFNVSELRWHELRANALSDGLRRLVCHLSVSVSYLHASLTRSLHSFWELALPIMAVIVPIFMWTDIKALYYYLQKKMTTKQAVQKIKRV